MIHEKFMKAFTNENDSVMIQTPVYYPFTEVIKENNRIVVDNTLIFKDGVYGINFEDMENRLLHRMQFDLDKINF